MTNEWLRPARAACNRRTRFAKSGYPFLKLILGAKAPNERAARISRTGHIGADLGPSAIRNTTDIRGMQNRKGHDRNGRAGKATQPPGPRTVGQLLDRLTPWVVQARGGIGFRGSSVRFWRASLRPEGIRGGCDQRILLISLFFMDRIQCGTGKRIQAGVFHFRALLGGCATGASSGASAGHDRGGAESLI